LTGHRASANSPFAAIALGAALAWATAAHARVVLRGGIVEEGPIVNLSPAGVEVGGLGARLIGWDAVRRIEGEHEQDARRFAPLATELYRARARLDRGDVTLASPIFETLYEQYRDAGGPTGRAICEGVLRCRLASGDQAGAVGPWLGALEAKLAGARLAGGSMARSAIEPGTGLARSLPPVFAPQDPGLVRIARATTPWTSAQDGSPRDPAAWTDLELLAACYRAAADAEAGRPAPVAALLDATPGQGDPLGAAFTRDLVVAQFGEPDAQAIARERLSIAARQHAGTWREAWARAAIGRSLSRENRPDLVMRGVIELLHVPARFRAGQPYLAGVCLGDAADALERLGLTEDAQAIRDELRRTMPNHPAAAARPQSTHDDRPCAETTHGRTDDR